MSTNFQRDRSWVDVHLGNLLENARTVQRAAQGASLLPMVKANAYGLGAIPVARALESLDPWGFGIATIDEGGELREAGTERPIVVFTPASESQLERCRDLALRPVLDDPAVIRLWDGPYHCEINTGMGRAGLRSDDPEALHVLDENPPEGLFTHLHSADTSPDSVTEQLSRFEQILSALKTKPDLVHVANSAGAWRVQGDFNLVRPGIFLYGGCVGDDLPTPKPVASVRARVVSLRQVCAGDTVSYGADWTASAPTTIATLGIGYADGLRRSVQGKASVLIDGRRYPIVGRVTMDMTMVDLGTTDAMVRVGEIATVIGPDGEDEITLDEFANWAGTISYEILTGMGTRLPRIHT